MRPLSCKLASTIICSGGDGGGGGGVIARLLGSARVFGLRKPFLFCDGEYVKSICCEVLLCVCVCVIVSA